jgi:hypothetical protein
MFLSLQVAEALFGNDRTFAASGYPGWPFFSPSGKLRK